MPSQATTFLTRNVPAKLGKMQTMKHGLSALKAEVALTINDFYYNLPAVLHETHVQDVVELTSLADVRMSDVKSFLKSEGLKFLPFHLFVEYFGSEESRGSDFERAVCPGEVFSQREKPRIRVLCPELNMVPVLYQFRQVRLKNTKGLKFSPQFERTLALTPIGQLWSADTLFLATPIGETD